MIWSRERQGALAEKIIAALKADERIDWEEDSLSTRRFVVRLLAECDRADEQLRKDAETKVSGLKRNVPPGSQEWEILVRNHMATEYERLERFRISVDRF